MLIRSWLLASCLAVSLCGTALPAATGADAERIWDLRELYPDDAAWNTSFERMRTETRGLSGYKGRLDSAAGLYAALDAWSNTRRELVRLYVYANLVSDSDVRVAVNQERRQRVGQLFTEFGERTAWLAPELIALGSDKVHGYVQSHAQLKSRFDFFLDDTLRGAPHTLGLEGEGILAAAGNLLRQPDNLHTGFSDGEMPYGTVKLHDGTSVQLSESAYSRYRQSNYRADRKLVFDSYWSSWKRYEATYGNMLATQVMGDAFRARARHYDSSLQSALFGDNMPVAVYRTLVAETHHGLPTLHRYLRLRKRLLGIADDLHYYDNYPPLFPLSSQPTFNVADAKRITLAALQPLGEEYLGELRRGFGGAWMNVYPGPGKKSGAYMSGAAYDVHPFLLLNHNDDFESVSTFAHEWGHAVHTLLSHRAQPYEKSDYSTFTAESASIGNQMLLNDYMVANASTRTEKLHYLGQSVEEIRTIYFRQVMFAEFELAIHESLERGEALSGAKLTELYCGLLRTYYGEAQGVMKIDPAYCIEWAYIPHFYYNFYLYQYATSMAGAAWLTAAITDGGAPARERFLDLLRAGGSDYPYALYKKAGLDMASAAPYQALVKRMDRLLDEIESLEKQGER
jgi:oligoendopeptidase F